MQVYLKQLEGADRNKLKEMIDYIYDKENREMRVTRGSAAIIIAEHEKMDDVLFRRLVKKMFQTRVDDGYISEVLDKSSKQTFDKYWDSLKGDYYQKAEALADTEFIDSKQLEELYKTYISGNTRSKYTTESVLFKIILSHHNCPTKIIERLSKNEEIAYEMARNSNLTDKALGNLGNIAKENMDILGLLLENERIDFEKLRKVIDIDSLVAKIVKEEITWGFIIKALEDCLKRQKEDDVVLGYLYSLTKDVEYLPKEARDVFVF